MAPRTLTTVALVVVLLAGCSVPIADDPGGTAGESDGDAGGEIETAGDLPFDPDVTFERTARLLAIDGRQPALSIADFESKLEADVESRTADPFLHALNLSEVDVDSEDAHGVVLNESAVYVDPNGESDAAIERVLVHEYTHALQYQRSVPKPGSAETTDEQHVVASLLEGGAVWATDRYVDEHHDDREYMADHVATEYAAGPPGDRYFRAPYRFGTEFFDRTVDDAADFWATYEDPPATTSGVIHGDREDLDPAGLSTTVEERQGWPEVPVGPDGEPGDRMGEMVLHVALESELPRSNAAAAADGWADDERRSFEVDGEQGHVWTVAFESGDDADEFYDAFDRVTDERTDEYADEIDLARVGERTVTVVAGSDAFREAVELGGDDRHVVVRFDGGER